MDAFLFINTLQIRASPTLEKHHGKSSDELQTTAEQIITAQYLNIFLIAHPVKALKALKRCKQSELYSLESILIEEERHKLNTQIALNGKAKLLTIY